MQSRQAEHQQRNMYLVRNETQFDGPYNNNDRYLFTYSLSSQGQVVGPVGERVLSWLISSHHRQSACRDESRPAFTRCGSLWVMVEPWLDQSPPMEIDP